MGDRYENIGEMVADLEITRQYLSELGAYGSAGSVSKAIQYMRELDRQLDALVGPLGGKA